MPPAIATEAGRFHGRWRTEGSAGQGKRSYWRLTNCALLRSRSITN